MEERFAMAVGFALDIGLKATLLFLLTGLALLTLRRASAASRHLVGTLGLAGALALPLLTFLLPRWDLPVVPSLVPGQGIERTGGSSERSSLRRPKKEETTEIAGLPGETSRIPWERISASETGSTEIARAAGIVRASAPSPDLQGRSPESLSGSATWPFWTLLVWALGAAFGLARLGVGLALVERIAKRASRIWDQDWTLLLEKLAQEAGIVRPLELLSSDRVPVAMTTGIRRPRILINAAADKWPADRRRVVLLHEMAHAARGDWLALLLAELAVAVYWFHPLAWWTVRQVRKDCEKACDDVVLGAGTKASVYAAHLLGIIRSLKAGTVGMLPAMPMARPSQFEARMRAILDSRRSRRPLSSTQKRLASVALSGAAVVLAAVAPWAPSRAEGASAERVPPFSTRRSLSLDPVSSEAGSAAENQKRSDGEGGPIAPAVYPAPRSLGRLPSEESRLAASDSMGSESSVNENCAVENAGDAQEASGFLKASRRQPKNGSEWYKRGMDLHHAEGYDQAIESFRKAIDLGYREDAASYNIACGYARRGENDRAFEWLEKAMDAGFDVAGHLDHDEDLEDLQADRRFRDFKKRARARRLDSKRDELKAKTEKYERLMRRGPQGDGGDGLYHLGKELLEVGEYDRAARAFQQAAEGTEHVAASLYNAACALAQKGDRRGALDYLEKAILAGFDGPKHIRKDDDLDNIRSEPRYKELVRMSEELELSPWDEWYEEKRGGLFSRTRMRAAWREQASKFEAFAKAHPEIGRAWFNLGYAQIEADMAAPAAQSFERALALNYRRPTTLYNLACSYALLDQKDKAFDRLFQAIEAGFEAKGKLRSDDDLDNLRGDPRFRKALRMAEDKDADEDD